MGDPFLNCFALLLLVFVVVVLFYGIIAMHDISHMIAESRHHPARRTQSDSARPQPGPGRDLYQLLAPRPAAAHAQLAELHLF